MMLYNFGHSFITAFFVVFFLYLIGKKMMSYAALAWPFHIMLDFPFHTKEFFSTKIPFILYQTFILMEYLGHHQKFGSQTLLYWF